MQQRPTLKDSGQRRRFEGGAVRDRGGCKPRPDLISPHAQMREGMILALGAEKYALRNWELGMPISECLASAQRHIEGFKLGLTDEDHLAQARVNLGFALHMQEEVRRGGLDPKWDDMPKYALRWDLGEGEPLCLPAPQPGDKNAKGETWVRFIPTPRFNNIEYLDSVTLRASRTDTTDGVRADVEHWDFAYSGVYRPSTIPKTSANNTCYIAGPMRGYPKFNFPTFDLARDLWRKFGWNVVSPADMDRENGFDEDRDPVGVTHDLNKQFIKRDCLAILDLDASRGDCLVVLPGWEKSKGAAVEVALARFLGLPICRAFDGKVVE